MERTPVATPLVAGSGLLLILGVAAHAIRPALDAIFFGLKTPGDLGGLTEVWLSCLVAAGVLYLAFALAQRWVRRITLWPAMRWGRRFLGFLLSYYLIIVLALALAIEAGGKGATASGLRDTVLVMLSSTLVAVIFPGAGRLEPYTRHALGIFALSLLLLTAGVAILDPGSVQATLVFVGLIKPPYDLLISGPFSTVLPYLGVVPVMIWSALVPLWQRASPRPPSPPASTGTSSIRRSFT